MRAGGFLGLFSGRKVRVRHCSECGASWPMPRNIRNPVSRNKGVAIGELYSASRLLSGQFLAGAREEAEVRDALAHCPQCGSRHFTEVREQR